MSADDLYQFITKRKSVRKYGPGPLGEDELSRFRSFLKEIKPLFPGIKVEMKVFSAEEFKGLLRSNAPHFLAFFSEPKEGYLANAGFMLQQADLYLSANNIGNCYQGLAKLTKGADAPAGLEFVISTSFGRPVGNVHRSGVGEFDRRPADEISSVKGMDDLIEAARLAPSSVNNQSWYFTGGDGTIHAYAAKGLIGQDMNKINVGIALCHIWLAVVHSGRTAEASMDPAGQEQPVKGHSYVASMKLT